MPRYDPVSGRPLPEPEYDPAYMGGARGIAEQTEARYQGMGAAGPQFTTLDTSQGDAARGNEIYGMDQTKVGMGDLHGAMGDMRGAMNSTQDAMGYARHAAEGTTPSQAQILGGKMIDDSIDSQMAMAASARGGPTAISGAGRQAAFQGAQTQQAGARDLAALRAQEMAQGRDQYLGAAGQYGSQAGALGGMANAYGGLANAYGGQASAMRGQDYQQASGQAALHEAGLDRAQQNQQYYEGLGQRTQQAQMDNAMHAYDSGHQVEDKGRTQNREDSNAVWSKAKDVAGLAAGIAGGISDVRAKDNIYPMSPPPGGAPPGGPNAAAMAQWGRSFGDPSQATAGVHNSDNLAEAQKIQASFAPPAGPSTMQRLMGGFTGGAHGFVSDANAKMGMNNQPVQGGAGSAYMPHMLSDANAKYIVSDDRAKLQQAFRDGMGAANRPDAPFPSYLGKMPREGAGLPGRMTSSGVREQTKGYVRQGPESRPDVQLSHPMQSDVGPMAEEYPAAGAAPQNEVSFPGDQTKQLDGWLKEDPMAGANRAQAGSAYTYKPEFAAVSGQAPGEMNVGPMAQTMASDPVAATAVKQDPNSGLMVLDANKMSKLHSAGIGSLQGQVDAMKQKLTDLYHRARQ